MAGITQRSRAFLVSLWPGLSALAGETLPAPQFYGYADVGPRYTQVGADSDSAIESRGTHFGLSGELPGVDLPVALVYQLEYEITTEDGSLDFAQTDSFVGIEGRLGRLRAGTLETPLRHLADSVTLFPDTAGDPSVLWNGDIQMNNALYYQTPVVGDWRAEFAAMLSEEAGVDSGYSTSLHYERDSLGLALAHDQDIEVDRRYRASAYWSAGIVTLALAAERETDKQNPGHFARLGSVLVQSAGLGYKLQFGKSERGRAKTYLLSLGVDWPMAERVITYLYYHQHRQTGTPSAHHLESGIRLTF